MVDSPPTLICTLLIFKSPTLDICFVKLNLAMIGTHIAFFPFSATAPLSRIHWQCEKERVINILISSSHSSHVMVDSLSTLICTLLIIKSPILDLTNTFVKINNTTIDTHIFFFPVSLTAPLARINSQYEKRRVMNQ